LSISPTCRSCVRVRRLLLMVLLAPAAWGLDPNRPIGQYIHQRWGRSQAFSGGEVNAIAQTDDGYLWIGARNGLYRFDGIAFRAFDLAAAAAVPAGPVLGLRADAGGGLWVLLQSPGLLRYYGGAFETPLADNALMRAATALGRGIPGDVLISRPGNPLRYRGGKLQPILPGTGGLGIAITETADGTVWIGTRDEGLLMIRIGQPAAAVAGLPDRKINCLEPTPRGDLWIGTDSGLTRWDGARIASRGVPAELAHARILSLARDSDENIWVGTAEGLARVDRLGNLALEPAHGQAAQPVNAIFEDRERNLWVGRPNGLEQYRDTAFFAYEPATKDVSGNEGPLYADPSARTWHGPSSGGLDWLQGGSRGTVPEFGNDVVYSLAGAAGEVWAGTRQSGLIRVRAEGNAWSIRIYSAAQGLAKGPVVAVCRQRDGAVWAGTLNGGLSQVLGDRIVTFTTADGLASNSITAIAEAADGRMWVATANGLQTMANGAWQPRPNQDELPPGRINSLVPDSAGVLWLATDSGLAFAKGGRIAAVRNPPAALQGQILGLADDGRGYLWIVTDSHVVRAPREALLAAAGSAEVRREFDVADGLPSTEGVRRHPSVLPDSRQRIWMSLGGGICVVDPSRVPRATPPAIVHIEAVAVDGERVASWNALRISSGRRRVAFDFLALSLAAPERVRYRYRLDPFDSQWSEPGEARQAVYTNLGPGTYRFRLVASNSDGIWNSAETSVPLTVVPHFWQVWWFQAAGGLAVLLVVFAVYRLRLHQLATKLSLRFEERLAERTRLARELHDTLLQGFLSVSMQVHVAAGAIPDDSKAKPILTRALQLMQNVIEEGRNTVRGLRTAPQEGPPLEVALSEVPAEATIPGSPQEEVGFRVVVEGDPRPLHPLLRDEVYRIGREAILNAFRHSEASHIEAELRYSPRHFQLFVRDDGTGIDAQILQFGREKHWGLAGMRERAERIGGQFHVMSREAAGTEIQLEIPAHLAFRDEKPRKRTWFSRPRQRT